MGDKEMVELQVVAQPKAGRIEAWPATQKKVSGKRWKAVETKNTLHVQYLLPQL
jgi:hypothetical protein